jgi:hypothetical protein
MDTINVNKAKLLITLKDNRDEHAMIYTEAKEQYALDLIAATEARLEAVKAAYRNDEPIDKMNKPINLPVPEVHTEDFDTAIKMLEWSLADEVELSQHEFTQYVENKWRWAQTFALNTASYANGR